MSSKPYTEIGRRDENCSDQSKKQRFLQINNVAEKLFCAKTA